MLTLTTATAAKYKLPPYLSREATRTLVKGSRETGSCQFGIPVGHILIEADYTTCDGVLGSSPDWGRQIRDYVRARTAGAAPQPVTASNVAAMIQCVSQEQSWKRWAEGFLNIFAVGAGGQLISVGGLQIHAGARIIDDAIFHTGEWCIWAQNDMGGGYATDALAWADGYPHVVERVAGVPQTGHGWVGSMNQSGLSGTIVHGIWAKFLKDCGAPLGGHKAHDGHGPEQWLSAEHVYRERLAVAGRGVRSRHQPVWHHVRLVQFQRPLSVFRVHR
jgi:hypothetical protein